MNTLRRISILFVFLLLAGCASNPMLISPNQAIPETKPDTAQVVFMRSSFYGSGNSASLYDVTDDKLEFIGIVDNNSRIVHTTTPGKHVFMVVSEAADFLEADLSSGKTYYSMVTPRFGAWAARFSLRPVRTDGTTTFNTDSPEFSKWLHATQQVEMSPRAIAWFERTKPSIMTKQADYWPVWQQKSPADRLSHTLNPEDGL